MYGVKKSTDLSFLLNRKLLQVCIGLYNLILNFEGEISITIEGEFQYICKDDFITNKTLSLSPSALMQLVGKQITKYEIIEPKELILIFSDGSKLHLLDSNNNFESFHIVSSSGSIVV